MGILQYTFLSIRNAHPMHLGVRSMSLIRNKAYINGAWKNAVSGKVFAVTNPADGSVIESVPDMDTTDTNEAIKCAHNAFLHWQDTTAKERSHFLRKWFDLLEKNKAELAEIVTLESGKPLKEATEEVYYGNSFIEWFSEEARRIHGEVIGSPVKSRELIFLRQPIGVAALITPWNFPMAMVTRKAGAALAAGCTCLIKPAQDTPLTALAIAALADEAGLPAGVFNVITSDKGHTPQVGKLFCESPLIAGISFTGSTPVGKLLYNQCAKGVKRLSLELGGNAPFIVFKSADLDKAVEGAMASKFRNCGQTCVSANRILVQEDVFEKFVTKFMGEIKNKLVIGKGCDSNVTLGPLINDDQIKKVNMIVQDAVNKGAKVIIGGKKADSVGQRYFEPTLITDVNNSMICYNEEVFGPVAVLIKFVIPENRCNVKPGGKGVVFLSTNAGFIDSKPALRIDIRVNAKNKFGSCDEDSLKRFKTEDEALSIANNTQTGLAGYFYSNDIAQIWRVAKKLEVGMTGINEGMISTAEAAFGGIKESGIGREGSHYGTEEYTYLKYLCFGNL